MARDIGVVLEHEMDVPSRFNGGAYFLCHLVEPIGLADGVNSVETQPVETVLHDPIKGVFGEETPDLRAAKIDSRAPRGVKILTKHGGRVPGEIIPVRPKMIVDHVEKYHQAVIVRGVN